MKIKYFATLAAVTLMAGWDTCSAQAADWLMFRGPGNSSVAAESGLPTRWVKGEDGKGENIAWQVDLPGRGVSSPIVVAGNVIITASSGFNQDRLHVLCIDAKSGQRRWERQFWATGRTLCHPTMAVAAPTPASDGKLIYAFYSSNDLACLDLDGNLKWFRGLTHDYPTAANDVGMAASPVVLGQTVVVQVECKGDSFAAGLNTATGETRWRLERDHQMNWTSPAVLPGADPDKDVLLLQSPTRLTAHNPQTGEVLWTYAAGCSSIPSAVADDGTIYLPADGLTALRASADNASPEVLWKEAKLDAGSASPLVHAGRVYTINGAPALTCGEMATGKDLWRVRLKGPFWATPVIAGQHMYCVNQNGLAQVVKLGESEGEIVSENDFGEPILGSPAVSDGALFFRSDAHLWKVAQP